MITLLSIQPGAGLGAETVLAELLRAWPEGSEPLAVVAPPRSSIYRIAGEVGHRVVPLATSHNTLIANWRAAGAAAPALAGARRVHAWAARGFEGARHLAARLGVPCGGTLHDHPSADFHGRLRRTVMKQASSGFDGLVCVSDAVRSACRDAGYRCPLTVVRNGLTDLETVPCSRSSGTVRIGFLGMYARLKGFDVIQTWVEALRSEPVEWKLYGTVSPGLADAATELATRFPGLVEVCGRRPVGEIFAGIDLLVHASSGFDSLPTVLIEAARAGIPCVACRHGGAGEIVIDGETGYLFPPTQPELGLKKVRELIRDTTLREHQAAAARERFTSAFGVARMVREYTSFWSEGRSEHHAAK